MDGLLKLVRIPIYLPEIDLQISCKILDCGEPRKSNPTKDFKSGPEKTDLERWRREGE
jgi:hypothetical protein